MYAPVGKIAEKAVCRSVFSKTQHCILSAELSTPSDCFFGDFAHWGCTIFCVANYNFFYNYIL